MLWPDRMKYIIDVRILANPGSIFSSRRRRVGWFKCICGGGRDQLGGHPMSFCFGTPGKSGGHAVWVTGVGVCCPAKFKELGLLLCRGQTALHSSSSGTHEEREKGSSEIAQGPGEQLACSPFNLGNALAFDSPSLEYAQHPTLETG